MNIVISHSAVSTPTPSSLVDRVETFQEGVKETFQQCSLLFRKGLIRKNEIGKFDTFLTLL